MSTYSHEYRRVALDTPLGKDVLLLQSFDGEEEMSRLFRYELDLLSAKDDIQAQQIVGKNITFSIEDADGIPRHFNGFVNRFCYCGTGDRLSIYRAEVVPWFWFLTRKSDCRIFQNKSVPDIIKQIFSDLGFNDFKFEVQGNHPQWEYCVQYRETDFNFISRLLEQEGIFYFFEHEEGKHTLVMADATSAYQDCPGVEKEPEFRGGETAPHLYNLISQWEHYHEFRSGKWAQTDYCFKTPTTSLLAQTNSVAKYDGNSKFELFDFPGEYEKKSDGESEVKVRMEEEEVPNDVVEGTSYCRSFSPGRKFKIKKHNSKAEEGKSYVITSVKHSGTVGGTYVAGGEHSEGYSNTFTCIPDKTVFRPARITPKPTIPGVQTALTVGPKGEEIYTDKYGRIKVQFFWDRKGNKDEKSSCFIRVVQAIAGRKWGGMFIPRIGQEVAVQFEEGDPDRPLVVGCVYNEDQMPAYDLPDEKTKSYIKTNSSLGGDGFNEIRMEDKKGKEQIFVHAEGNMDTRVKCESRKLVLGNQHVIVGTDKTPKDRRELVYQDQHLTVKGESHTQVVGDMWLHVGSDDNLEAGSFHTRVDSNRTLKVLGKSRVEVQGDEDRSVGGHLNLTVEGNRMEVMKMDYGLDCAGEIHLSGQNVVIEAFEQLTLSTPGGYVTIGPAGVAIQGAMVLINSGGSPGIGGEIMTIEPDIPDMQDPKLPDTADDAKTGHKSAPG